MIAYLITHVANPRVARTCSLGLAALLWLAPPAFADACLEAASAKAVPDFTTCQSDLPEIDIDAALAAGARNAPMKSGDGMPWIAQSDKGIPLTVNPSDAGVSLRTSLDDLRSYNTRTYSVDDDAGNAPSLPKTAMPKVPVDLWTNLDVNGYSGDPAQSTRAGFGADYKLSRAATVGVALEHGDARSASSGTEQDSKASAYVTLQATPIFSLDARTQWQAGNEEFASANGAAEKSSIVLAPKINKSFSIGDGKTISPFVTYRREFDLSETGRELDATFAPERSAGAGITYKNSDAYTLSATTDVDGLGQGAAEKSLSSKFKLSVPIN